MDERCVSYVACLWRLATPDFREESETQTIRPEGQTSTPIPFPFADAQTPAPPHEENSAPMKVLLRNRHQLASCERSPHRPTESAPGHHKACPQPPDAQS